MQPILKITHKLKLCLPVGFNMDGIKTLLGPKYLIYIVGLNHVVGTYYCPTLMPYLPKFQNCVKW
jgi:hypothetical protein